MNIIPVERVNIIPEYDIERINLFIYTNEIRNVLYAFDYSGIKRYPSHKKFVNGKFQELNNQEYDKIRQKFCDDFSSTTSAVLLIDYAKSKNLLASQQT